MARGNMIVTLVAQTKKFSDGLKSAGDKAVSFGSIVKGGIGVALGAVALLGTAVIRFLPDFIKMGEEARKSELRLANIADTMGIFGKDTTKVTKRISDLATTMSFATGIDDELIRGNEAVLLTFKNLASTATKANGPFDRAVAILNDLAAAGKDVSAAQLGKALEDPIAGMTALKRAGVVFNAEQKKTIANFVKSGDAIGAQDFMLKALEGQVGGTAEAMASNTDKMAARFEDLAERASTALLPAVDNISQSFADWMDSPQGKKWIDDFVQKFEDFGKWITGPDGKKAVSDLTEMFKIMLSVTQGIVEALMWITKWLAGPDAATLEKSAKFWNTVGGAQSPVTYPPYAPPTVPSKPTQTAPGGVVVNVTSLTPTAKIGTTVLDAIKAAQRLGSR